MANQTLGKILCAISAIYIVVFTYFISLQGISALGFFKELGGIIDVSYGIFEYLGIGFAVLYFISPFGILIGIKKRIVGIIFGIIALIPIVGFIFQTLSIQEGILLFDTINRFSTGAIISGILPYSNSFFDTNMVLYYILMAMGATALIGSLLNKPSEIRKSYMKNFNSDDE